MTTSRTTQDPPASTNGTMPPTPTNGAKGDRDPITGRFLKGHALAGPGNPHFRLMAHLRMEFLRALTEA
jgi:hypothetical protein